MKIGTPIKVEWVDISTISGWHNLEEAIKDLKKEDSIRYFSYGYFVRETKDRLSLAATMSFTENEVDEMSDITNIPKSVVKKVTTVL